MQTEQQFLAAIRTRPDDTALRLVYADWLEECGDARARFLRLHLALKVLAPDHLQRVPAESELSDLRQGCEPAWLAVVEPEGVPTSAEPPHRGNCRCFDRGRAGGKWPAMRLHSEAQDTQSQGWKRLLILVEEAAKDGREDFDLRREMSPTEWSQIVTLPPTIAKLKAVKRLHLYGSHLVRVPPGDCRDDPPGDV